MHLGTNVLKVKSRLEAQNRSLYMRKRPWLPLSVGKKERKRERKALVEKRNQRRVRRNDHAFCFIKNVMRWVHKKCN